MVPEAPAFRRSDWPQPSSPPAVTRPEQAAEQLAGLASAAEPGTRLGTKEELRVLCGVSVGTFNEALRLAQARGVVTVRAGRVGGLFASRQSPLVRLGNSVLAIDDDATSVADAVRIRDALDPLLVEDAVRHRGADDLEALRQGLARMRAAAGSLDGTGFLRANWALHARLAEISPNVILRSFYLSLLDMIESHTLAVRSVGKQPLPDYLQGRYQLHADLVAAVEAQDAAQARDLIRVHSAVTAGGLSWTGCPESRNAGEFMSSQPSGPSGPVERMMSGDVAARVLGIELAEYGPGWARMRMPVTGAMVNGHGLCHGGVIFTLADTAFACACNGWGPVTVAAGGEITFVAPARAGEVLTAEARARTRYGRHGLYDVTVTRDGQVVAEFRGRSQETRPPGPAAARG